MRIILNFILYGFVFATGATGLAYQVAWQKYLSRILGSDSVAVAIILATFLGGLSLGYYLCGKLTTLVKNQFKAYALLESVIAVWCLCFPMIFDALDHLTRSWSFSPPYLIILQGLFCSALLMGIPTMCMGGTIPLLTRGISRNISDATRVHSKVYGINTGGAFFGALLAGFFLIPNFGLPLTVQGAAFFNLAAGLFFYLFAVFQKSEDSPVENEKIDMGQVASRKTDLSVYSPAILYAIAFLSGFYVMTLENVLIRIVNFSLGSSSYSFTIIVAVFVLSIAVGSYTVGKLKKLPRHLLYVNQLSITILLLAVYLTLDKWPYWAHLFRISFQSNIVGFWMYYFNVFIALCIILILPVGFMGATVPIAFHEIKRELKNVGKQSGMLFSLNTIGNLIGSLLGGIVFFYFMNNSGVFSSAILLAAVSTCLAGLRLGKKYLLPAAFLMVIIPCLTLFAPFYDGSHFMIGTFRDRKMLSYSLDGSRIFFEKINSGNLLRFHDDGPTTSVSVVEHSKSPLPGKRSMSILVNGKSDSSTVGDMYTLKLSAHLPALLAEKRDRVMVIGLGTGVTAGEYTLYPDVKRIDIAEISSAVVEALPYFATETHFVGNDPRVHIHIGDAFRILGRSNEKWDIITSEPSNPWVTGVDLLFTEEFYRMVKDHLSEGGIFLQWAQIYSASPEMLGMIANTIQQVFPQIHVFMACSGDLLIVASSRPISRENLLRAESVLNRNVEVKKSLSEINLVSVDSILLREIWNSPYIKDIFTGSGVQTMDNPRLHYLAGKDFFVGRTVSINHLFTEASANYLSDYLLVRKYGEEWKDFPFDRKTFEDLLLSATDLLRKQTLPAADALKLKSFSSNPELFPLSERERRAFQTLLLPFVTGSAADQEDWAGIGLGDASYSVRARILFSFIQQHRNWVSSFSIDGLKALLSEGIILGNDEYEKNWCALQSAVILLSEKEDPRLIQSILNRITRREDGGIALKKSELKLLNTIENSLNQRAE